MLRNTGAFLGTKRLRRNLASFFNTHFDPHKPVHPENVFVTAGVGAHVDQLGWVLGNPGDGFLVGMPMYGGFTNGSLFSFLFSFHYADNSWGKK
jgi:aspartate/methionine/tyrosine aminotransferase